MNISFNPKYHLKQDEGRVLLMPSEMFRSIQDGSDNSFESVIHPIYAIILAFFNNTEYEEGIRNASNYLNISIEFVKKFIDPLIENDDIISFKNNNQLDIVFPRKTLIRNVIDNSKKYSPEDFVYENVDISHKRHKTPTDITLMVNTTCATNCFYCYADRRIKTSCKIPLERVYELIDEAKSFHARSFEVIGGEFFLYKNWKEVLIYLYAYGFHPYISTKVNISKDAIDFLASNKITDIQVSLDTLVPNNLTEILNVDKNYIEKIKGTLIHLNESNVGVYLHTILNSKNQSPNDMKSIYDFIKDMNNIIAWRIDKAGPSLYLNEDSYENYRVNKHKTIETYKYLKKLSEKRTEFAILPDGINPVAINDSSNPTIREGRERASCSANYSQLFILPDGNVTVCEELYWHDQFIIGNVLESSLLEIWNSNFAKYIRKIPQKEIPSDSACSACNEYDLCRDLNKICWKDVIKAYGNDKWYYPDVACSKAPSLKYHVE